MDAQVIQGDDIDIVFNVKTKDEAAVDLTGITACTYKVAKDSVTTAVISKTLGSGITVTDAANGEITVTLTNSDTDGAAPGKYYHELQITDAASKVRTVRDFNGCIGKFDLLEDLDGNNSAS